MHKISIKFKVATTLSPMRSEYLWILTLLWVQCLSDFAYAFHNTFHRRLVSSLQSSVGNIENDRDQLTQQLVGSNILCNFSGFGVSNMSCVIKLETRTESDFEGSVQASKKGFWRVLSKQENVDVNMPLIEVTHIVLPEYLYFFDLSDRKLVWKANYDVANKRIVSGKVVATKKRLGLFPYEETLATFEGQVFLANEKKPVAETINLKLSHLVPPEGFDDPGDMLKFPDIFTKDFTDWWFAVEDAMARGETPPPRTKDIYRLPSESELIISGQSEGADDNKASIGKGGKSFRRRGFSNSDRRSKI